MSKQKLDAPYTAPRDHAVLVDVPDDVFLTIDGRGSPHGPAFQGAIRALYAVTYGAKYLLKQAKLGADRPVGPLEALWWWNDDSKTFPVAKEKEWRWRLMIRQPLEATRDIVQRAIATARAKHPELALDFVEYRHLGEGPCMQIMHVGPYRSEAPTIEHLHHDMEVEGYEPTGMHHEIYLDDPRRAKPEKLRTLLRQPVRRTSGKEMAA